MSWLKIDATHTLSRGPTVQKWGIQLDSCLTDKGQRMRLRDKMQLSKSIFVTNQ